MVNKVILSTKVSGITLQRNRPKTIITEVAYASSFLKLAHPVETDSALYGLKTMHEPVNNCNKKYLCG